jgi:hypothetical protein
MLLLLYAMYLLKRGPVAVGEPKYVLIILRYFGCRPQNWREHVTSTMLRITCLLVEGRGAPGPYARARVAGAWSLSCLVRNASGVLSLRLNARLRCGGDSAVSNSHLSRSARFQDAGAAGEQPFSLKPLALNPKPHTLNP